MDCGTLVHCCVVYTGAECEIWMFLLSHSDLHIATIRSTLLAQYVTESTSAPEFILFKIEL
jgi:hypothetical protein